MKRSCTQTLRSGLFLIFFNDFSETNYLFAADILVETTDIILFILLLVCNACHCTRPTFHYEIPLYQGRIPTEDVWQLAEHETSLPKVWIRRATESIPALPTISLFYTTREDATRE